MTFVVFSALWVSPNKNKLTELINYVQLYVIMSSFICSATDIVNMWNSLQDAVVNSSTRIDQIVIGLNKK